MERETFDIPDETLAFMTKSCGPRPFAGAVVLGSGLGTLLDSWETEVVLAGEEIPGYPRSTVPGHAGRVAVVRWGQNRGLAFQGRVHFYEGYARPEVTFAVRLAAALGAKWMMLTNAAGSLDANITPGTIMVAEDHIRILFLGAAPLRGARGGSSLRGSPYHPRRTEELFRTLSRSGLRVVRGTLMGCLGPTYESASEVEMSRRLGAHAACMSTVIEVEEAARCGLETIAASLITNLGTGLAGKPLSHDEVVEMAGRVGPAFADGIARVVALWAGEEPTSASDAE